MRGNCSSLVSQSAFTPWGRTRRDFPLLSWDYHRRGNILAWCRPCGSTLSTGLGPSGLFGLLLLMTSATDVTPPLGTLHQNVHRRIGGAEFAHICANLPTEHLHISAFQLPLCVNIPTNATCAPKADVRTILCSTILLGGSVEQIFLVAWRPFIRILTEEPVDQFHGETDLSTPPSSEGRHDGVQLPFEMTLNEIREEVEGSAL